MDFFYSQRNYANHGVNTSWDQASSSSHPRHYPNQEGRYRFGSFGEFQTHLIAPIGQPIVSVIWMVQHVLEAVRRIALAVLNLLTLNLPRAWDNAGKAVSSLFSAVSHVVMAVVNAVQSLAQLIFRLGATVLAPVADIVQWACGDNEGSAPDSPGMRRV